MTGPSLIRRRVLAAAGALAVACTGAMLTASPAFAGPGHTTVVADVPSNRSPNILDGEVDAIYDNGTVVLVGGTFTQVQNHGGGSVITQKYLLAFSKATGDVITTFKPILDNPVYAIQPGPTAATAYIGGKFNSIQIAPAAAVNRKKLALINIADGSVVTSFANPAFDGVVNDIQKVGSHLLVGGIFTLTGTTARGGLASLNPTTGADDGYLTVNLAGHHNWTSGSTGANSGVGASKIAVSPDGTAAVVIGNFKTANGAAHDQALKLDLTTSPATLTSWGAQGFTAPCNTKAFDSWVRDVKYSPDGTYFVVVGTGGPFGNTFLCDTITKWAASGTSSSSTPIWANWTGGDTVLSVAVSEQAIYVGGHMRWLNNSGGSDFASPGAIGRASIAALDPISGLPLKWNPGRNPRGFGVTSMMITSDGLWLGYDTDYLGNNKYLRQRIGFFPLAGGLTPAASNPATLPGKVYLGGQPSGTSNVLYRVNAGGPAIAATDGGPDWAADNTDASPYRNTGSSISTWAAPPNMGPSIPTTAPPALFLDERWDPSGGNEMQWAFSVPAGTPIEVHLYFANQFSGTSTAGKRVFNINLDGQRVINNNYDIVKDAGSGNGVMKVVDTVSDGTVNIDFLHVVENPLVDAIEIIKIDGSNVMYRVNAGGPAVASTDVGPMWEADTTDPSAYRNTGSAALSWTGNTLTKNANMPLSFPMAVFNDERYDPSGGNEMQWAFPVPAGTRVQVRLYFAEQWSGASTTGKRVFNVVVDGVTKIGSLDIVKDTGYKQAEMRFIDVVSDGTVNVDFTHSVENPLLDAIEVVKTDIAGMGFSPDLKSRTYNGTTTVGSLTSAPNGGMDWSQVRGAFWVGGQLFYGLTDGKLHVRTFDGTTFGADTLVDPYHDALWDTVNTGTSGQSFAGNTSAFYGELSSLTGLFFSGGRIYYTLAGQDGLYWRWFTADTGAIGADKFQVTGATGYSGVKGMFTSGGALYTVTSTGALQSRSFSSAGVPGTTVTTVSGPAVDGVNWLAKAVFIAP